MKLVIDHEPHRLVLGDETREYAVYLEGSNNVRDLITPIARFDTEAQARRYCELRQRGKRVAEYDL